MVMSASIKENRKDNYGKPCIDVEIETWQLKHFKTLGEARKFMTRLLNADDTLKRLDLEKV